MDKNIAPEYIIADSYLKRKGLAYSIEKNIDNITIMDTEKNFSAAGTNYDRSLKQKRTLLAPRKLVMTMIELMHRVEGH